MTAFNNDKLRLSILAALAAAPVIVQAQSAAVAPPPSAAPTAAPAAQAGSAEPGSAGEPQTGADEQTTLQTIVVTGSTSQRTLLNASVDVTVANEADLQQRAPRATADILDLVPGIFVEGTAGPVSNNYSVRGLPGGGQGFIMLEEDGMPIVYGGGGADEYFQNDITIDHVEALEGGTSGILSVNGASATINFISRKMNFDQGGGLSRLSVGTYGEQRADLWYSAPLKFLGDDVAFSIGGYLDSSKGVRSSPFTYQTYHLKAALEKRLDHDGFIRVTYKRWDEHDPYYADMPYQYNNGNLAAVPGLNSQYGNITGPGFAEIGVPDSCATGNCVRDFSASNGIHSTGNQYRIDLNAPINDSFSVFARARFLQSYWDFNGVFPGSGSGNAGLTTALNYLTPGANSPISALLTSGLAAFPGTTEFGIRNLTTGQVLTAANVAALNGLNGNGLLQQTVLNQQFLAQRDFGSDFGVKYSLSGSGWTNSLTVGAMYYRVRLSNDQSAVATLINGVSNGSSIYDVVGLNGAGAITGSLTNNGLLSYGDWGAGIWSSTLNSFSGYFNDELAVLDNKLHLDFGARREDVINVLLNGNTAAVNAPVPPGTVGLAQNVGSTFDGTYTRSQFTTIPTSWTVGANYEVTSNLAVYGRYEFGNQTNDGNTLVAPARVALSEAGIRYGGYGLVGSAVLFRTVYNHQNYGFTDPTDPTVTGSFLADSTTNGVDVSLDYRPTAELLGEMASSLHINFEGTYQRPKLGNVVINGVEAGQYNGNTPQRTPQVLYAVTPAYDLPGHLGQVYLRYKYTGKIYADSGDGIALPGYGTLAIGGNVQLTDNLNFNINVDNVTNVLGVTEGNPRQGNTQSVVNGYFYGRGIVGPNALASLTYKF